MSLSLVWICPCDTVTDEDGWMEIFFFLKSFFLNFFQKTFKKKNFKKVLKKFSNFYENLF